jgi:hypothetical protein
MRKGDRYVYKDLAMECTEVPGVMIIIKGFYDLGETREGWNHDLLVGSGWKFIGNFDKSNKFKLIYDILNSEG